MKRRAKLLLEKATDSLLLSVEQFNKPFDTGRIEAVLILMDHSLEMLLKASIVERGGNIKEKGRPHTIGFDKCLRVGLSDDKIKFLSEEQVVSLQFINGLRDAAQHYLLEISEEQLYIAAQTGVSLFRDILKDVFEQQLIDHLPDRVLPISTRPPASIDALFQQEIAAIKSLLQPGRRKRTEARARLRPLTIMDKTIQGRTEQPSDRELNQLGQKLIEGKSWEDVFPGVSAIDITTTGYGPSFEIHWTKKEGIPIQTVPEGTPGAWPVAVKRVNELDFYSLSLTQLRQKFDLTQPKCLAVIWHLGIQSDPDCFKEIRIGKSIHKRYSQKAQERIEENLDELNMDEVWEAYNNRDR